MIMKAKEKILVIQTAFLGDLILSTTLFKKIKLKHPDSHITLIVNKGTEQILSNNPNIDTILPVDKKQTFKNPLKFITFLYELQKENFSICYSPHFSHRSSLISFFSGAKIRIGYKESGFGFLHTKTYPRPLRGVHEVQKLLHLVDSVGLERPEIFLDKEVNGEIKFKMENVSEFIVVAPSSIWETKRMPIDKFIELVRQILENTSYTPVIIGSKNDQSLSSQIVNVHGSKVIDMTGRTNLMELSYIISKAKCVISNDSSPIHIASAFNIPTLAIFGATITDFGYTPLSERHTISEVSLECRPCGIHGGNICPKKHFRCMMDQNIEEMFLKLKDLLHS
jgi:heptosyltransferase II